MERTKYDDDSDYENYNVDEDYKYYKSDGKHSVINKIMFITECIIIRCIISMKVFSNII